jgi:hypothetical protein
MLTTFDLDKYVFDALVAGASGFSSKTSRRSTFAPDGRATFA